MKSIWGLAVIAVDSVEVVDNPNLRESPFGLVSSDIGGDPFQKKKTFL